jgi:hypothetical protein
MNEVDTSCRKETKDLYVAEGRVDILGAEGIPDSLKTWLTETKEKILGIIIIIIVYNIIIIIIIILGSNGHKEKAWKRLWKQVARYEVILSRRQDENNPNDNKKDDDDEDDDNNRTDNSRVSSSLSPFVYRLGSPAVIILYLSRALGAFMKCERIEREEAFMKLVRVWEKGRDKNERLLRPKLGSPDAIDELNELDQMEEMRSKDFTDNVIKFRSVIIRRLFEISRYFLDDINTAVKSLILLIDSSLRQEALKVPPDTPIPKIRMTLKRLRKAHKLKENIAKGQEDISKERTWPGIDINSLITFSTTLEDVVRLDKDATPAPTAPSNTNTNTNINTKTNNDVT